MIPKREGELKSAFSEELRHRLPQFVTLLFNSAGAPDRAIFGNGRTTTWEFKHATPDFDSPGLQELMCMRLDVASYCRYVLWREDETEQRTMVVRPRMIHQRTQSKILSEAWCVGFDHEWLVNHIKMVHGL